MSRFAIVIPRITAILQRLRLLPARGDGVPEVQKMPLQAWLEKDERMNWDELKRRPFSTGWRLGLSLLRKRTKGLSRPVVRYHLGESRIIADL
ncbi:MAG TPA: hypothetical protein VK968_08690, partial [Roseimicrobium sp.]|nr:hypothetical protein [Roseimicrobium sp.]